MRLIFTLSLFLFSLIATAQKTTVSGTVRDGSTGESLIGASVFNPSTGLGTTTNEYGFYSLSLPAVDSIQLIFSYIGFTNSERSVGGREDRTLNVELGTGIELQEVVIKADSYEEQLRSTEMSVETINPIQAKIIPVLLGESDILKTIQLKPGIPSGSEGTTGLFVRGGASDQNLILLDEAVVYNPNHLFGFFSTFNTDAVKDLKLYKGGFPAQYGGRLSSVIDVKLKEGNNKRFSGTGGVGLISSRLTLEGPLGSENTSFIVSGRRTYVDLITRQVNKAKEDDPDFNPIPDYFFYDLNTKINHKFSDKDRIYLSGYFGRDKFGFNGDFFDFNFDWGNITGTLRWNHVFSPKLFANTTVTVSDYRYEISNVLTGFSFSVDSNIKDVNLKSDFYYALNNEHTLRYGLGATYHEFTVGRFRGGSDDGTVSFNAGSEYDGVEFGTYLGDEWDASSRLRLNYGLRVSGFTNDGENYFGVEPRLAARYTLTPNFSLKASYARMNQYVHLIASSGISLPTDVWYPSTPNVKPEISDQVAVGYSTIIPGTGLFFTNEYYYKSLQNQLDFVDGASLVVNDNLEQEFAFGEGEAYGAEFSIEKKEGRLTGWIGYTLARVIRKNFQPLDPNRIFGEGTGVFAPRYDRRHDLSVVGVYDLTPNRGEDRVRFTATTSFVYGSGDLSWLPVGRFSFQDVAGESFSSIVPIYQDRNNIRLAPYIRWDVGLVMDFKKRGNYGHNLTLSIVNATDRRNAFFVFLEPTFREVMVGDETIEIPESIAAQQVSLFPILPSFTYNFSF